ncbi:MAG: MATE family efflux transporter [Gammaproteobacteria bacterium]
MTNNPVTAYGLIHLAAPAALSAMLNNAFRMIDQYAVQWLGVDAQAAIGSTTFVLIGFFAVYSIVSAGAVALISRAVGAQDGAMQRKLIGNALSCAALLGVVILSLSGLLATWTAVMLGLKSGLAETTATYLRWHALFCFPQALAPTIDAIFIAFGKTKTVLLLQTTASVLNFLLNPVFIYELGFGIGGAAIATGISQGVAVLIGLYLIHKLTAPDWSDYYLNESALRIAKIGLPMCWGILLFAGVYWAMLYLVISPMGGAVNAALGIGFSVLEGFTWPVFWGFSMALASLIGRYLGAEQFEYADQAIRFAFTMMTAAGLVAALIFWYGASPFCSLFTQDPEVLRQSILYARILAFSQLFIAYEALAEGILSGAGDTKTILAWSAPFNLLRIPCSWLFAIHFGYGPAAVWWTINISTLIKTVGKWRAVRKGRWKTIRI